MSERIFKGRIARRLIIYIVLFSSLITLIATGIQLYHEYHQDINDIDARFSQIEASNLQSIAEAVWVADRTQLRILLDGIRELPDIIYAEVRIKGEIYQASGEVKEKSVITRRFALDYPYRGKVRDIGELKVVAGLSGVYQRLIDRIWIILVSNGIKTFLVAIFIYYIFAKLVTRHLTKLADFAGGYTIENLDKPLTLDREVPGDKKGDEFDTLVTAINRMQANLAQSVSALQESEERVRLLLESTEEAIYGVDTEGNCTFVNPACVRMLRYKNESELLGKNMHELIHHTLADGTPYPEERCQIRLNALQGKSCHSDDEVRWRADGSSFPVEYWSHPIRRNGEITGVVVTFIDITERKLALEKLNEQAQIVEQVHDSVIATDMTGKVTIWNKGAERLFGYTAEEMLGRPIESIYPEHEHQFLREQVIAPLLEKGRHEIEARKYRKNGEMFYGHLSMTLQKDSQGNPIGMIGYTIDISERKQAEEALRLQAAALESAANGILITDRDGVIIWVNKAFTEITGYSLEDAIGRNPRILKSGEQDKEFYKDLWDTILAGRVWRGQLVNCRKDGRLYIDEQTITSVRNEQGEITHFIAVKQDITTRKQVEDELNNYRHHLEDLVAKRTAALEAVNEELESFSYSVSHDLRAPLRAIDGFSLALLEDCAGQLDQSGRDYLQRVRNAAQHMAELIDDLLMLSRVGRGEIKRDAVDLSVLAETAIEKLEQQEPAREGVITIEPNLVVEADERLMRIVLDNLLGNAWKYTSRANPARITFGAEERNGQTVYYVRDNGIGFDMRYAHKLFGAFQRLHRPEEFPGTGIGLATVQRIIHRHQGRIWAQSKPGEGSVFYFVLPENRTDKAPA